MAHVKTAGIDDSCMSPFQVVKKLVTAALEPSMIDQAFSRSKTRCLFPGSDSELKCVSAALHFLTPQHTIKSRDGGRRFAAIQLSA